MDEVAGATLARIREKSGASVRCLDLLDSNDAAKYHKSELSGSKNKRLVSIEGLTAQVETARRLVLDACGNGGTSASH